MREDGKIIENTLDKFPSFSYGLNIVEICAPIYIGVCFSKTIFVRIRILRILGFTGCGFQV
jgi:hypothetical protein